MPLAASASDRRNTSAVAREHKPSWHLRSDGNSGAPGRSWSPSNWPQTSSMNRRRPRSAPLISRTRRGFGPLRRDPLPWRTFGLPEPAQLQAHVLQVEHADLVDPQADVGLQPGGGVVRAAGASFRQVASSSHHPENRRSIPSPGSRERRVRAGRGTRPVHLVQRALGRATTVRLQISILCRRLAELEVHRQRGRPPGARRRPRVPQHRAEVRIGVRGLRLPTGQRTSPPITSRWPVSLRIVLSASPLRGGPCQRAEPGQRMGLEPGELLALASTRGAHAGHAPTPESTRTPSTSPTTADAHLGRRSFHGD